MIRTGWSRIERIKIKRNMYEMERENRKRKNIDKKGRRYNKNGPIDRSLYFSR